MGEDTACGPRVRQFSQVLVWPLQLMPIRADIPIEHHWELLQATREDNPWEEAEDDFPEDPARFQTRHYSEFVTFLPYVQRMLYGEGRGRGTHPGESPIHRYRRRDIRGVRCWYPGRADRPLDFAIPQIDLYFCYDLEVVLLTLEMRAEDILLDLAQETLFRFGRSYPTYWTGDGHGGHCLEGVGWLDAEGTVLAQSDYESREKYLCHVSRFRTPGVSAHWEFLLRPMVLHHSDDRGALRYRLVEYHRMPLCAFLSFDEPRELSRADFVRLGFVKAPGPADRLPQASGSLRKFETRHCLDRYWNPENAEMECTRALCTGEAFVMVATHGDGFEKGGPPLIEQFRHQYFLVFLIAHLHKAVLFMHADHLLQALNHLEVGNADSVRRFKREIRRVKEKFLRFTHRYWCNEVSDQPLAKDLYHSCRDQLGNGRLYAELREEIEDMSQYLDSDSLRRQANTVLRLTVVTILAMIGSITTGFLGMNLIDEAHAGLLQRLAWFVAVFLPTVALTMYTIVKSKRLSDFLDALSDDAIPPRGKLGAFFAIWRR